MNKKSIENIDIKGKRVLMRVDFNVPQDDSQRITDDTRIKAALPTIKYALENNAAIILMSHLGRPKGKVNHKYSLKPVSERLAQLIGKAVTMAPDCIGPEVKKIIDGIKPKDIVLLENLRFHKEEEANDPVFAQELASYGQVYVNDAFGTAHRPHASTHGVTSHLPAVAGFLVKKEIEYFQKAVSNPQKPYVAILGGAKVSDKIEVIKNLMKKVDAILIGGGMAYTFLKAQGKDIGNSKLEADKLDLAKDILAEAEKSNVRIMLPQDHIITDKVEPNSNSKIQETVDIPSGFMGVDIGPKTAEAFEAELKNAKTQLSLVLLQGAEP